MKKQTLVILFALISTVSLYGCSKANIEKETITIQNTKSNQVIEANAADLSEDIEDPESLKEDESSITETDSTDSISKETESHTIPDPDKTDANDKTKKSGSDSKKGNATTTEKSTSLTIEIEGTKETVKGTYFNNKMLGYNMVYDESRFKYSSSEGSDSFMAENPDPEIYPYVYLNISRVEEKTTLDKYTKEMKEALSHGYKSVEQLPDTTIGNNYKAVHLKAKSGNKWNSSVRELYLLESEGSIYMVEKQYFVEAEEGYGARMHAMIDTFKFN
ncbi:hypothetical protein EDD66_101433 [Mobilisporobacter senegalensis]|uniref:Lipoprotein n=1 Tax=Mobilisporobacter senegalensis TaxID=1329262 RepID=A0A3N1XZ04_9FIRM|nr:hypothetical protein [Mobilisporobacter senegalensis]ROR31814.1 hypothetical protein EDD66_101433 [Mobilisporobacter senegalensis]